MIQVARFSETRPSFCSVILCSFQCVICWLYRPFKSLAVWLNQPPPLLFILTLLYLCWFDLSICFLASHVVSCQPLLIEALSDCSVLHVLVIFTLSLYIMIYWFTNFRSQFFVIPTSYVCNVIPDRFGYYG